MGETPFIQTKGAPPSRDSPPPLPGNWNRRIL